MYRAGSLTHTYQTGMGVANTTAYEVLSSPDTRKIYDQHGEAGLKQQQQSGGMHFHDPFDIFSQYAWLPLPCLADAASRESLIPFSTL